MRHCQTVHITACGCGNFLIIAYRELRALELRIHERLQQLDASRAQLSLDATSRVHVKLSQFYGIEIEEWPATIARTAMFLVEHQANQAVNLTLGYSVPMLPLQDSAGITVGNALRLDWEEVVPPSNDVYVFGNPPFLGHATRSPEQAQELRDVWERKDIGRLDYATGWYRNALDFFGGHSGRFAFVSTNSVTQGEPVPALFGPIFKAGWRIRFAHRTFAWSSEAPGAAAVYCVIIGFDRHEGRPRLFTYKTVKSEPVEAPATTLNAYLVDGPNVLVEQRRTPLSPQLPPATMGSMPRDGGHLLIGSGEYDEVMADPVAAKYVRPFVMGKELIHSIPRWCLWLVDLDPSNVKRSQVLTRRLEEVREFREASRAASTRAMAATAHLFGQRSQPVVEYLAIPKVFTDSRNYVTATLLPPEMIAGDKVYKCEDPEGFAFAVISSSMFITWQKTIGGRLKNDPEFSNTLTWNTLPLGELSDKVHRSIVEAGAKVVDARALHAERTLAQHYTPGAMDPALVKAHAALDRVVDRAFGAPRTLSSNEERAALLFEQYAAMTSS